MDRPNRTLPPLPALGTATEETKLSLFEKPLPSLQAGARRPTRRQTERTQQLNGEASFTPKVVKPLLAGSLKRHHLPTVDKFEENLTRALTAMDVERDDRRRRRTTYAKFDTMKQKVINKAAAVSGEPSEKRGSIVGNFGDLALRTKNQPGNPKIAPDIRPHTDVTVLGPAQFLLEQKIQQEKEFLHAQLRELTAEQIKIEKEQMDKDVFK
jgi:hypothetical protein